MAKNYLKRRFTVRETVLLCILFAVLLLGLYFGCVFYPIQDKMAKLNISRENLESEMAKEVDKKEDYDRMKKELNQIAESGDDTVMPETGGAHYRELLDMINEILVGIDHPFSSSVSSPTDGIVKRTIGLNFTVNESNKGTAATVYDKVHTVLIELLTKTKFRCSMASLTLNPGPTGLKDSTSIEVSTVIEFFELG